MGCGCGKKSVARPSNMPTLQSTPTSSMTPVAKASLYQSATMTRPPTAPVTRKTV